jgi:hypothetical protein
MSGRKPRKFACERKRRDVRRVSNESDGTVPLSRPRPIVLASNESVASDVSWLMASGNWPVMKPKSRSTVKRVNLPICDGNVL